MAALDVYSRLIYLNKDMIGCLRSVSCIIHKWQAKRDLDKVGQGIREVPLAVILASRKNIGAS